MKRHDDVVGRLDERMKQFEYSVGDLKNHIDTTDTYVDQFLPFRTLKEITTLLAHSSLDRKQVDRIKVYEAKRTKELYKSLTASQIDLPDFKTRLVALMETQGKQIHGAPVHDQLVSALEHKLSEGLKRKPESPLATAQQSIFDDSLKDTIV